MVDSSSESDSDSPVAKKAKYARAKYLLLKPDISAQNEGKNVLATSSFQIFLGEHVSRPS